MGASMAVACGKLLMKSLSPLKLAVPFRVPFYAPFYAALKTGAYARQGLDVVMEIGGSGQAVVDALLEGRADVAWGGPARVMHERDADPASPLRCFCSVVRRDPFLLVGHKPRPGFRLEDLPNHTLGTVTEVPTPWLCLQDDLRRAGIDPAAVRCLTGRTMAENAQAVARGELDIAQLFEPHASLLEMRGEGAVWLSAAERGDTAYTSFIATSAQIAARRTAFRALVCALADTLDWIAAEGPAALSTAVQGYFDDIPPEVLQNCLSRYFRLGIWSESPHISRESFDRLAQALASAGSVARLPDYDACVESSIVEEALSQ